MIFCDHLSQRQSPIWHKPKPIVSEMLILHTRTPKGWDHSAVETVHNLPLFSCQILKSKWIQTLSPWSSRSHSNALRPALYFFWGWSLISTNRQVGQWHFPVSQYIKGWETREEEKDSTRKLGYSVATLTLNPHLDKQKKIMVLPISTLTKTLKMKAYFH